MPRKVGPGSRGGLIQVQCKECGVPFTKGRANSKRYCSWACAVVGRGRAARRREKRICKQCGVEFEIRRCHTRGKHTGQFCSRVCTYAYWREHPENHPFARNKIGFSERRDEQGYVWVSVPGRGSIRQHALVLERVLGRRLDPWETVHHKNGDRSDNRPENLELWNGKQPAGVRSSDALAARLEELEERLATLEARFLGT